MEVLRLLDGLLRDRQIRYLLSGRTARELLLVHVRRCAPGRVTSDLGFGLIVSDWSPFDDLKGAMEATVCAGVQEGAVKQLADGDIRGHDLVGCRGVDAG